MRVTKQKYAASVAVQPSHCEKRTGPTNMKLNINMRLTMIGTITRSVGIYRSFPISSKLIPFVLRSILGGNSESRRLARHQRHINRLYTHRKLFAIQSPICDLSFCYLRLFIEAYLRHKYKKKRNSNKRVENTE